MAGYLGPNRSNRNAWEHQGEVKRLTEWWLVDVDARKEALRGGVVGAKEEDVDEAWCRVGSGRRRFKWSCGIARELQARAIGLGPTVEGESTGGASTAKTERRRGGLLSAGACGENGTEQRKMSAVRRERAERGVKASACALCVLCVQEEAEWELGRGAAESRRLGAGEATANAAPSARGRRGDVGFVGWGGETRRSNCAWDSEASHTRIGEKYPPEIKRAWEKIKRAMETGPTR